MKQMKTENNVLRYVRQINNMRSHVAVGSSILVCVNKSLFILFSKKMRQTLFH